MIRTKYTRMTVCHRGYAKGSIILNMESDRLGEDFVDFGDGRFDKHNLGLVRRWLRYGLLKTGYQPVANCRHADCPNAQRFKMGAEGNCGLLRRSMPGPLLDKIVRSLFGHRPLLNVASKHDSGAVSKTEKR